MRFYPLPRSAGSDQPVQVNHPIFVADLHLSRDESALVEGFLRFLTREATHYDELFLLGDIFDAWIGDDERVVWQDLTGALRALVDQGVRLYLMQGNRDFFLNEDFASACGGTLLRDPTVLIYHDIPLLISHGDGWCTEDHDYMRVRARVRRPWWQATMLLLPRWLRREVAARARAKSKARKQMKPADIMDVSLPSIAQLTQVNRAQLVIHGHTHRGALHEPNQYLNVPRAVIPDWRVKNNTLIQWGLSLIHI